MMPIPSALSETGKLWSRRRLVLLGILVSGVAAVVGSLPSDTVEAKKKKRRKSRKKKSSVSGTNLPGHPEVDAEEQTFLGLINTYRASKGKGALTLNPQLTAASAAHSMDMGVNNFFSHINRQKKDPGNRASAAGYRWKVIGENLAAGSEQDTAADAFTMWQNSPEHNHNMLDEDYRDIGIGREYVEGSRYGWYWTTLFGKSA